METKRCICGRKVEVAKDDVGYFLECTKCGKTTQRRYRKEKYAVKEWNRDKDITDMVNMGEFNVAIV